MREAPVRCHLRWTPAHLVAPRARIESGALSLKGLITHTRPASAAPEAYEMAFGDAACLKMILDWKATA